MLVEKFRTITIMMAWLPLSTFLNGCDHSVMLLDWGKQAQNEETSSPNYTSMKPEP